VASLSAARNALANQLSAYVYPTLRVSAYPLDQINPPCAMILPSKNTAKYGRTLGGPYANMGGTLLAATDFNLDIIVITSHATTTDRMQETLDQWIGFTNEPGENISVPMAIAKDDTLGGVVAYCEPETCDSYGPIEWNGISFFGARIHCCLSLQ
jgi:hypothetical protein